MTINVTKSLRPDRKTWESLSNAIVETGCFSNGGPYVKELESVLQQHLGLDYGTACSNGTLALQLAIRALGLTGKKVITTPFSYVATVSALLWEGCEPVFVDIDPDTLCITPDIVEKHMTAHIAGVLPVHVFGNACDVKGFARLSKKYDVPILYDAAHAFGCRYEGQSLFTHGACSVASFHATKLFHTCEGGAIFCQNKEMYENLRLIRQFGHLGDTHYTLGINAKLSEMHAAMGLSILPLVEQEIAARKKLTAIYDAALCGAPLKKPCLQHGLEYNYSYYPVLFENEKKLLAVKKALESQSIFPRRYFYPSLHTLPYLTCNNTFPFAELAAQTVLCLPLYGDLSVQNVETIVKIIQKAM